MNHNLVSAACAAMRASDAKLLDAGHMLMWDAGRRYPLYDADVADLHAQAYADRLEYFALMAAAR